MVNATRCLICFKANSGAGSAVSQSYSRNARAQSRSKSVIIGEPIRTFSEFEYYIKRFTHCKHELFAVHGRVLKYEVQYAAVKKNLIEKNQTVGDAMTEGVRKQSKFITYVSV